MSLLTKIGLGVAAFLLLFGAYEGWAYHERKLGEAAIVAKDAQALAEQKTKDAALSAKLVTEREARIQQLEASAATVRERIIRVPVTTGCGPAVGNAADFVRDALSKAGGPPAGR